MLDNPLGGAASAAAKVAAGDAFGPIKDAADAAAMGLLAIPVAGPIAGAAIKTFAGALDGARQVLGAFTDRARQIKDFNGQIAVAAARQDVTRLMADVREAQRLGDRYAAALDKETQLEEVVKVLLLPIKDFLLEHVVKWMDLVLDFLETLVQIGYSIPGVKDKTVTETLEEMRRVRKALEAPAAAGFGIEEWMKPAAFGAPPAGGVPAPRPLDIPLLPFVR
jgi:hypothetical protein